MNGQIQPIGGSDYSVENIHHVFASECTISGEKRRTVPRRRCKSEPDTGYSVNYDDLCGPWSFAENPFHAKQDDPIKPRLCVWKLLTPEGIASVKRSLDDEAAIKHLIARYVKNCGYTAGKCELVKILKCYKNPFDKLIPANCNSKHCLEAFNSDAKENELTEEGTSALVGMFHLTFMYFVANPWRTVEETYKFFYATALLHAVENPPKSIEIFSSEQCAKVVEFFLTILAKHLPLVRFVCVPNYVCILNFPKRN